MGNTVMNYLLIDNATKEYISNANVFQEAVGLVDSDNLFLKMRFGMKETLQSVKWKSAGWRMQRLAGWQTPMIKRLPTLLDGFIGRESCCLYKTPNPNVFLFSTCNS